MVLHRQLTPLPPHNVVLTASTVLVRIAIQYDFNKSALSCKGPRFVFKPARLFVLSGFVSQQASLSAKKLANIERKTRDGVGQKA